MATKAPKEQVTKEQEAPAGFLPVEYIGRRAGHTDTLYGTRIAWAAAGDVQLVPEDVARKMVGINHDVYRLGEYAGQAAPDAIEPAGDEASKNREELDMVIQTMGKEALEGYARQHFGQELDRRKSVDVLRGQVRLLVDQFGAP